MSILKQKQTPRHPEMGIGVRSSPHVNKFLNKKAYTNHAELGHDIQILREQNDREYDAVWDNDANGWFIYEYLFSDFLRILKGL